LGAAISRAVGRPPNVAYATDAVASVAATISSAVGADFPKIPLRGEDLLAASEAFYSSESSYILVALPEDVSDEVLASILRSIRRVLASDLPWHEIPRSCLLVARDASALAGLAERAIARARRGSTRNRFAHFSTDGHSTRIVLNDAADKSLDFAPVAETTAQLVAAAMSPAAAIAYRTHGIESCAQGGMDVVLCGRQSHPRSYGTGEMGILGCGLGHRCPRGPFPLPLSELDTEALFLASCNGLRLRDGSLDKDFNLGLTFLDGRGCAYVSSVNAGFANEAVSLIWIAAMADGKDAVEATLLANALVLCGGIDVPNLVPIGLSDIVPRRSITPDCAHVVTIDRVGWSGTIDFGMCHLAEFVVKGHAVTGLVAGHVLLACEEASEDVLWFCRAECLSGESVARVWIFRFPKHIGAIGLRVVEADVLQKSALASLAAVRGWSSAIALCESGQDDAQVVAELGDAASVMENAIHATRASWRFSTHAVTRHGAIAGKVETLAIAARDYFMDKYVPLLDGAFWLPNRMAGDYTFNGAEDTSCPHCGGVAQLKRVRHRSRDEERRVTVCFRCLIALDVHDGGDIESVTIEGPKSISVGETLAVSLVVRLGASFGSVVRAGIRMTTRKGRVILPRPVEHTFLATARNYRLATQFDLPRDLLPHQYQLKALVSTNRHIAFAQTPFMVTRMNE
jgi:hypothetical protein